MPIMVTRSSMPPFEEYCEEIRKLWDSHWLTNMGTEHETLERMLKECLGCPETVLFTNGHLALENVIAAFAFPAGSEVITTPFTFVSTTHAILRNGLVPVFCDVEPVNYTMDPSKIEALITEKTAAIVPVHVYGHFCAVDAIGAIAKKHGLKVIYDAAHAFGETCRGKSAAVYGDAAMFSFHATKVFNTIEGGAVCTADPGLAEVLCDMKNFGIRNAESCVYVGGNAKMNEFQAAMGICNLRHLEEEIGKRRKVVERYRRNLAGRKDLVISGDQEEVTSNCTYFPVIFPERDGEYQDLLAGKLTPEEMCGKRFAAICSRTGSAADEPVQAGLPGMASIGSPGSKPSKKLPKGGFAEEKSRKCCSRRDRIFERLRENGILARKYFYPLTCDYECYAKEPAYSRTHTPVAAYLADRVLTLPLYADLDLTDVDRICELL